MNKLLLVDGHNLLFQMFYGMPARIIGKDGVAVQGVVGFVGALLKIIRMTSPTHLCVIFDSEHENPRTAINPDYKANRPDYSTLSDEENPFTQLPYIYAALDELKIKHTETCDCETDDIIAAYAINTSEDTEVVISSFDSDFFQLISDRVSVLRYRGEKSVICDSEYIKDTLGITPSQYADFKSLVGDSADNIKGAEKIGPKTAARLLSELGDLEGVINMSHAISKPSVRESVIKNTERIRDNFKMIKLSASANLPFTPCELEYRQSDRSSTDVLRCIGVF